MNVRQWMGQSTGLGVRRLVWLLAIVLVGAAGFLAGRHWPEVERYVASAFGRVEAAAGEDSHAGHEAEGGHADEADAEHDHEGEAEAGHDEHAEAAAKPKYDHPHDEADALKLSSQAKGNIGLRMAKVELRPFERAVPVPGVIVERPGWSTFEVTAPMTGIVTRIYPIQGEAVEPGQPLFEVRLTHEDLLQAQAEFLRTVEQLDVIGREVARLEKASTSGALAPKTVLERRYEQEKQEASLRSQRQALLLHGLTEEQVETIRTTRNLLPSLMIRAPGEAGNASSQPRRLQIEELKASQGKYVTAGTVLCTLVDHGELYIEGRAFEQDIEAINRAASQHWAVSAIAGTSAGRDAETIAGLKILYLDDRVDPESRAFRFYVSLPNRLLREDKNPEGRRFLYWQFRPGQKLQLKVPLERWTDRIVLPIEAVAPEGAEFYVFEANGDHFDRRPVRVEYRDQQWAVVVNDGALRVGGVVAASAAHQMQMALKNRAGGGVDPHAGHNH